MFRNVRYLDVFHGTWRTGDVSVVDGFIVGLEPGLDAKRIVDGKGRTLVPGFVDAHVHVESSMMVPAEFERAVVPRGTTTVLCDPHEIANVLGRPGLEAFLDAADELRLDMRVMLSSCVPATHLETNGGGTLSAEDLAPLLVRRKALGLAEMMNVPGVLHADPSVLEKLEAFDGRPIDGHCPLLRGRELSAYATAGIQSCHESTEFAEASEKLTKGLSVWIREGSVAKDLAALVPLLTLATSTSIAFCTDDRNPLDIAEEGHVDHLVRGAIAAGVDPVVAYRAASWSPARHYGLRGLGAVAPGYRANLVLLDDVATCAVRETYLNGVPASELPLGTGTAVRPVNSVRASRPTPESLLGPSGNVHVIGVEAGKLLTSRSIERHDAPGVARLSVLERYGHGSKPANGYVRGFGDRFRGAIASSVGHDSHNLIVVGTDTRDMATALGALIDLGGGFAVVQDGAVRSVLPLPYGGLMATRSLEDTRNAIVDLREASRSVGCALAEPFLQLAFLSLPVIPSLKLTDKGLVDVDAFQLISVSA
jgi:adenine deaminase